MTAATVIPMPAPEVEADGATRLYTLTEAAEHLKVSVKTLRRINADGLLPFTELRGTRTQNPDRAPKLVRADHLQTYIDGCTQGGTAHKTRRRRTT